MSTASAAAAAAGREYGERGNDSNIHRAYPCKCSQCDPNYYTVPLQLLFTGNVEYVCRDCQFATQTYQVVQQHEGATGHRRWYNYPQ
ncbi:hypothetical protein GGI08_005508 [Coemansia sp. S2]|nr:hypothetical protein GGI08_005508 [Coemansia sp. S2]KAJ2328347.1 hypothetical protein GGH92_009878 [Coemansia sp. RSA 2673]